ncbi:DUF368 domain-containing protein [Salipaludibacillus neizhouensis]|uniref:DUF368 domain-containing protein n=1 Tax=Salipaludibacillus neizhouensis TaxID=885475 RepID=A0A3A9K698_9BACI|nr:DUF368 domain-containing protein [Salipaludibacillus neizhouensis]RKL68564.1 DUF368 domain-containing protein [Salipaludibacillus neizhouensis]
MDWKNIYRGIMMGISDLIPGVSGGTIAVLLGIYSEFIAAINGFFSKDWRKQLPFLIPLGIGIVVALLGFSQIINWLMENHFQPTQFFFLGLVLGIVPMLVRMAEIKTSFTIWHYLVLIFATVLVTLFGFIVPEEGAVILDLTFENGIRFFLAGWLASMAMLMPGISGSLVLLLFGVYFTATSALSISSPNIPVIIIIGSGVVVGFIICSKFIKHILLHYPYMTYAAIIGLVLGSVTVVYPGLENDVGVIIPCIITFLIGSSIALFLGSKQTTLR